MIENKNDMCTTQGWAMVYGVFWFRWFDDHKIYYIKISSPKTFLAGL